MNKRTTLPTRLAAAALSLRAGCWLAAICIGMMLTPGCTGPRSPDWEKAIEEGKVIKIKESFRRERRSERYPTGDPAEEFRIPPPPNGAGAQPPPSKPEE